MINTRTMISHSERFYLLFPRRISSCKDSSSKVFVGCAQRDETFFSEESRENTFSFTSHQVLRSFQRTTPAPLNSLGCKIRQEDKGSNNDKT
jgi:hypothetical protein